MKKFLSLLLFTAMIFSFAACAKKEEPAAEEPAAEEPVAEEPATEEPAAVELEDTVVIYSTHGEDMLEVVAEKFEEKTGVKVDFINLKGELADRVRAEKENPKADVMFGGASSLFMDLKAEGLFDQYEPSWGPAVDGLFKDSENYWFGTIQTPVMMCYNTEVFSAEEAPKDWKDLADPKYKDQLVFRNALSSSARVMYSALLQKYEKDGNIEEGWEFMKAMDSNTKQYYNSGSLMMQAVGRKEAGITFSTLNSIIDNKLGNDMPIEVIDAESGSPVITDGIALIKNAPHPAAAKAFIDFAGSAEMQSVCANEFNRMPTHPDAIATSPEWMGQIKFKIMDVDWVELSAKQSEYMQKWDTEIKDASKDKE